MLPIKNRLPLRDLPDFFMLARKTRLEGLMAYFLPSQELRLAVIVPKTVSKLAVDRNYLKRVVSQEILALSKTFPAVDLAIVMGKKSLNMKLEDIRKQIQDLLLQIK